MEKRFEEKMEQRRNWRTILRRGNRLVEEGEKLARRFGTQVCNVCIGLKQNQWKCSGDVSEMQTRHKSRHAHVVAVGSTKYDSEFQFSDSPLLLQQFCKFERY